MRASRRSDPQALGGLLLAADAALSARGLRVAFARDYGGRLARLDPAALSDEARTALAELLLLAGAPDAARRAAGPAPDARFAALLAVAGAGQPPAVVEGELLNAALAGLAAETPADDREARLAALVAGGRQGQAILAALDLLRPGSGGRSAGVPRRAPDAGARRTGDERPRPSRCRPCCPAAPDARRRHPLAGALSRGDPGRARRLAQHHPFLCPRSHRLRGVSGGARPGLCLRLARRDRGLPGRPGRPRHGAGHPRPPAVGDPPALPLRLPRGLARGRPRRADQGPEAAARPAGQPQRDGGRPPARRRRVARPHRGGAAARYLPAAGPLRHRPARQRAGLAAGAGGARRPADDPRARQGRPRAHGAALAALPAPRWPPGSRTSTPAARGRCARARPFSFRRAAAAAT